MSSLFDMKRSKAFAALLYFLLLFTGYVQAAPAFPCPIDFRQSDGTSVKIVLKGDEFLNWKVSSDGYTLLQNDVGDLEYAILNESANLVPSGKIARNVEQRDYKQKRLLKNIPKGLFFSKNQIEMIRISTSGTAGLTKMQGVLESPSTSEAFPTIGKGKLLCILIGFSDKSFTLGQMDFNLLFNQIGYDADGATGSVKDYYLENSYGKLDLSIDVVGPYTASNTMQYYGNNVRGSAPDLIREAVLAADKDVNFADYDNDGNGDVDGIYVIYAGYGEEAGGGENAIWSHSGLINLVLDGVRIKTYSCSSELRGSSGTGIARIGVIAHEFGHILGAVDLYDTDNTTGGSYLGTGNWDIMAGGVWNNGGATPAHHNGWTKVYKCGWATPTILNSPRMISLKNSEENCDGFFRINSTTAGEYYFIENREKLKFDSYIPGNGMLIYHIHKDVNNGSTGVNDTHPQRMYPVAQNSVSDPYTNYYGSINDASCAWNGTGKSTFSDSSIPSAKAWSGTKTYKPITAIMRDSVSKIVRFNFMGFNQGVPPSIQATAFSASNIQEDQCTIHWSRGNGDRVIVLARKNISVNVSPPNGIAFSASADGYGGDLIDEETYVIYDGTDTSVTFKNLQKSSTYHFAIFEYNISDYSYRTPGLIGTLTTAGCSSCTPTNSSTFILGITDVVFNTINNKTESVVEYSDFKDKMTEIKTGQTYILSVKLNTQGSYTFASAWIDWNRDCVFQSSEEYGLGSTNNALIPLTRQITIPLNAYAGKLTMRVRSRFNAPPSPCGSNEYSETEDYTLNLVDGCSPPTIQCSNFTSSTIFDNQATIGWKRGNGDRVIVLARRGAPVETTLSNVLSVRANSEFGAGDSVAAGTFVVYDGIGTSVNVTDLLNFSVYHFAAYEYFSSNHCYLTPPLNGVITTTGFNPCIPKKTEWEMYISKVVLNTINNTSVSSLNGQGYSDFTRFITELTSGLGYTLSVNVDGGTNRVYVKAWVDWNRDNSFQPSEEYNLGSTTSSTIPLTVQIKPPARISNGHYLLRIRSRYNTPPTACDVNAYSEAEDYTLKIVGGCTTTPTQQAATFTVTNILPEQMTLHWIRGNGDKVMVVASLNGETDQLLGGNLYANADFGSGSEIGKNGYLVYDGSENNVTLTGLMASTAYNISIFEYNSMTGCVMYPPLVGSATTSASNGYYCTPTAMKDDATGITKVTFNTIDNISDGTPSFSDYSSISTTVLRGNSYDLSVKVNTSGNYSVYTKVWIDWNKDYFFGEDEVYNLGSSINVSNGLTSNSPLKITVPETALSGVVRMRVRSVYNIGSHSPCAAYHFNEAEDYTLLVKSPITNIWDGVSWSCSTPTSCQNVVLNGNYNDVGFTCNDLTIMPGKQLAVSSGTLDIKRNLILKSDVNGTATLLNSGALNVAGMTYVEQFLPTGSNWSMSSPLSGSSIPSGIKLFKYNEPGSPAFWESISSVSTLPPMTGFLVQTSSPTTVTFTGLGTHTVNSGTLIRKDLMRTGSSTRPGFNLIGNPYPSYLNAAGAINNSATLDKSMWFWMKNASGLSVFDVFNTTSGIGTNNNGFGTVCGIVPPMHSFWVRVCEGNDVASLTLDNTMRLHEMPTSLLLAATTYNRPLIRLQVSNNKNLDEAIVYVQSEASCEFDEYDSPKISNCNVAVPEIYTFAGKEKVAINGIQSFAMMDKIKLGFKTETADSLTIKLIEFVNFDADARILLKDSLLNRMQDLSNGFVYRFKSVSSTDDNRFSLVLQDATTLNDQLNSTFEHSVLVYRNAANKIEVVRKNSINPGMVSILNTLGQKLVSARILGKSIQIEKNLNPGVYLLVLEVNGESTTQKFILN
jgi:M6 family metalloprotease-like protein